MAFDNFLHKLISFELAKPESPESPPDQVACHPERYPNFATDNSNFKNNTDPANPLTSLERSFRPPDRNFQYQNFYPNPSDEKLLTYPVIESPIQVRFQSNFIQ